VISDKEEINQVNISKFNFPVKAIVINHSDHAYAKVRYDERSLKCFEEELFKIQDYLTRSVIWRQLWFHVMDGEMSSLQYFELVNK